MTLRGRYADIVRRLDQAERLVRVVAPTGPGCATCAGWPAHVVAYPAPPEFEPVPDAPWYCRPWARPHGDDCPGCVECHPRSLWPESFACPDCFRTPANVIFVRYEEAKPRDFADADDPELLTDDAEGARPSKDALPWPRMPDVSRTSSP